MEGFIARLTKKAEPPPTRDVNRDSDHGSRSERFIWGIQLVAASGTPTASANGGWLRRLVRRHSHTTGKSAANQKPTNKVIQPITAKCRAARLNKNDTTKSPTNENQNVIPAASLQTAISRTSIRVKVTTDAMNSASKIKNKTLTKPRCRFVTDMAMTPNEKS